MTVAALTSDELRRIPEFADLTDEEARWLSERAEPGEALMGEQLFVEGAPATEMMLLVTGAWQARKTQMGDDAPIFEVRAPCVTGLLPLSRMTHIFASGFAAADTRFGRLPATDFPALLREMPRLEARFVARIATRVRESAKLEDQHTRLMELGKLSAGLAHELGNPAAALGHASEALRTEIGHLTAACTLLAGRPEAARRLTELERVAHVAPPRDALARSDAEERLGAALAKLDVPAAYALAPELVEGGVPEEALLALLRDLPGDARGPVLAWSASRLATQRLLAQLQDAVERIRLIVGAVKTYSHMDRAPSVADVQVADGIRSTLVLLGHVARRKQIRVLDELPEPLPCVPGYPGELNQVWTNLLDNAIDALPEHGTLRLGAVADADHVTVLIEDDGPGIPAELLSRIWEPFFTTKPAGEGTGLGLDIVRMIVERRHGGRIAVESEPGRTRFSVQLRRRLAAVP